MIEPALVIRQGSASYPVFIGEGILSSANEVIASIARASRTFLITSAKVREKCGSLLEQGIPPIVMPDGEEAKTLSTAEAVVTELIDRGAKRDSIVVVMGGGVVGDTAGFAASVLYRGIRVIHVPTTLLSQVDSSIGGKVAVNHPAGKNLIGSFHAPVAVISDVTLLRTLPPQEVRSGVFEALKSGVIGDPELFALLQQSRAAMMAAEGSVLEEVVRRSVKVKAAIVSADEKESGDRRLLNYGHTIGHGIEAALKYEGLTHGEAVAWGMIAANEIARRRGLLTPGDLARLNRSILDFEPAPIPNLDRSLLFASIAHDKKFGNDRRVMILPRRVGKCEVFNDISEEEIRLGVDALLER